MATTRLAGGVLYRLRQLAAHTLGLAGLRREDVILSSFPRSGSTWMRLLFCNLISLSEWDGKPVDFSILNATMPEFGISNLLKPWSHSAVPRVIKTHKNYLPVFWKNRSMGIIRDPRDVMVSFYNYLKYRKGRYDRSFSEFVRDRRFGLEAWFEHYISWRDRWTFVVQYEEMQREPLAEFTRVLDTLGVGHTDEVVCEAIRRASFDNVREAERRSASITRNKHAMFARDGRVRQWPAYFARQDLMYYGRLVHHYGVTVYYEP